MVGPRIVLGRRFAVLLVAGLAACADGATEPPPPPPPPPLSSVVAGTVRDAEAGTAIGGATVRAGGQSATSATDGSFELEDLEVGSVQLEATATGFEPYARQLTLVEGANTHDVAMTPVPTATLSGRVTAQADGAPVSGASVSAGGVSTASGADGNYELHGLPEGPVRLEVSAAGFDTHRETLELSIGENARDVALGVQSIWELGTYAIRIPREVTSVRGVLLYLAGEGFDTRAVATGDFPPDAPQFVVDDWLGRIPDLAREHDLAILGALLTERSPERFDEMFTVLGQFGTITGHPELAGAALVPTGFSWGGCFIDQLTDHRPERILAFQSWKPSCPVTSHFGWVATRALDVPGYYVIAEDDATIGPVRNGNTVSSFEATRAEGAPWALAIELAGGHTITQGMRDFWFAWLDAIIERRLDGVAASGTGVDLNPVDQTTGWLGNLETQEISEYGSYAAAVDSAAWFPSREAAEAWQVLVNRD